MGIILISEEIVNALFGYGSFTEENINMTALALKYFGFGVPAFALIKILSNFYFARNDTQTPFYISSFIVGLNVSISLIFFKTFGFLIIPIATTISTWVGVLIYLFYLNKKNFLLINNTLFKKIFMIIFNTVLMSIILIFVINYYHDYLDYNYKYKSIYMILIVGFVVGIYLISSYVTGLLKEKNFKMN